MEARWWPDLVLPEVPDVSEAPGLDDPVVTVPIAPRAPATTVREPALTAPRLTDPLPPEGSEPLDDPDPDPSGTEGKAGLGSGRDGTAGTVTEGTGTFGTVGVGTGVVTVGTETVGGVLLARMAASAPGSAATIKQVKHITASAATRTDLLSHPLICVL